MSLDMRKFIKDGFSGENRKKMIVSIILCTCIFGLIGWKLSQKHAQWTTDNSEQVAAYEENILLYDDVISEAQESIKLSQEQVDSYQEYCDNSIYMQLDPSHINIATVQYAINNAQDAGKVLNAYTTYINDGSLKEELSEALEGVKAEYLREIISCYTSSNILNVTVMHYEKEQAEAISAEINQLLNRQASTIRSVQGNFDIQTINQASYEKADAGVNTTQNNNRNTLRGYLSSLADWQQKKINQETARNNYIENNQPENGSLISPKIIFAIILLAGIFIGMLLPYAISFLRFVFNDTITSEDEALKAGLQILGTVDSADKSATGLIRSALGIRTAMEASGKDGMVYVALTDSPQAQKTVDDLTKILQDTCDKAFEAPYLITDLRDMDQLKKLIESGICTLLIQKKHTRFCQVDDVLKISRAFRADIAGGIFLSK